MLPGNNVIRSGIVCTAANIDESWLGTDVTVLMSAATGRDATVLNDADAAGLAVPGSVISVGAAG